MLTLGEWSYHSDYLGREDLFLYSSSVYSCHLFLISSASVRYIPFLSSIVPIFACNGPLVSLIFLKRSLVSSILLFSSISLHWSLRKAFFSLLAILWNSAFRWVYPSFSPLPLASLGNYSQPSANLLHSQDTLFINLFWLQSSFTVEILLLLSLQPPGGNLLLCYILHTYGSSHTTGPGGGEGDLNLTTISSYSSSLCASRQEKNPSGL